MSSAFNVPYASFWKQASAELETLIQSCCKYNNKDLLEPLPDPESGYKELPRIPPFHLKSSSLDTSYKTYNPKHMEVIERSKRFDCISNERKQIITPKVFSRTSDFGSIKEIKESFQVAGRKAKILLSLQENQIHGQLASDLNMKLKEFIGKVKEKYARLVKTLEFQGELLSFDSVVGYLTKSSIMLKRPTLTRDRQQVHSRSPGSPQRKPLTSYLHESFSSRISEKVSLLTVFSTQEIFDPFKSGFITQQHFFGILTMYEYTNFGMAKHLPSSRLDLNNIRHLQTLRSQVSEIKRIYQHYSDGKLLTREGFTNLLLSICAEEQTHEILHYLKIGQKVSFGQFMCVIPLLLENYDSLMIKVKI
jgi:hypothetical protein